MIIYYITFCTRHPVFSYRRWRSNTSNRLVHARVSPNSMAAAERAKPPPPADNNKVSPHEMFCNSRSYTPQQKEAVSPRSEGAKSPCTLDPKVPERAQPPAEEALAWLLEPWFCRPRLTLVASPICLVESPRRPTEFQASRASRWEERLATSPPRRRGRDAGRGRGQTRCGSLPRPPKGSAPRKAARQSRRTRVQ
jgi:hypothetical protein